MTDDEIFQREENRWVEENNGLRTQLTEMRIHRENLLRCCKALVRHEVISASRAREVCGVSADYWREFVRGCPAINEKVSGYIEELPDKKETPQ